MIDFDSAIDKLVKLTPCDRTKMLYQWVKTDVINQKTFILLMQRLFNPKSEVECKYG